MIGTPCGAGGKMEKNEMGGEGCAQGSGGET